MTFVEIFSSFTMSLLITVACGMGYAFAASDTKPRKRKTIAIAAGSGMIGWGFAMLLPINEYKFVAAFVVALIASIYGSHIYWFIFKEKSKTTKFIDANHGQHHHA